MPCEITIYSSGAETLCPHPSIAVCCDCYTELCSAHSIECSRCSLFICPDCAIEHGYSHTIQRQKLARSA